MIRRDVCVPQNTGLALVACLVCVLFAPACEDSVDPKPPEQAIRSPQEVIAALSRAYQTRDPELLASLLSPDPGAEYLFLLSAPTDIGETQWGYSEEVRIHYRMFHPEWPLPPEPPIHPDLWMQSVTITLTPQQRFTERQDLYAAGGLDSLRWRAAEARYTTYVYFDLAGTDYKVEGEANFIVIDDRAKQLGDAGKFRLYIWEDIAPSPSAASPPGSSPRATSHSSPARWGDIKGLYRD